MDSNKKTLILTRQNMYLKYQHKDIINILLSDFSKASVSDKMILNALKIIFHDEKTSQIKILKNTNWDIFPDERRDDEFIFDIPTLKKIL